MDKTLIFRLKVNELSERFTVGADVSIGSHTIIEDGAVIGNRVVIGHGVVIKSGTVIGDDVWIGDLSVLGKIPQSNSKMAKKPVRQLPPLLIDAHVKIGCSTVLYAGVHLAKHVLVGDLASIRERVSVGAYSIVGRNVVVEPNTRIGERVTLQTSSYITSDMVIEDEVFVGPCCSTSNDKYMGLGNYLHQGPVLKRKCRIGNNATLLPGITIGEEAVVGAGTVVTKDVPPGQTVVGNPGKLLHDRKDDEKK